MEILRELENLVTVDCNTGSLGTWEGLRLGRTEMTSGQVGAAELTMWLQCGLAGFRAGTGATELMCPRPSL